MRMIQGGKKKTKSRKKCRRRGKRKRKGRGIDLTRKPSISDGKLKQRTKNFTEFLANNPTTIIMIIYKNSWEMESKQEK